ncbi:DUF6082 family protein [Streptomyces sp. MI02-7b]|uniref:DUF6082 family protein n=1 Tax=Streptomyces sp. MI02-7b TaxID=462941 RepID=UPI0029ADCA3C|nr:DUF6082 family protein [Streptomyces sp. MI02-7b]MDX3075492.1 hypothetical protein [Streptomyces sp. MI02-7b]
MPAAAAGSRLPRLGLVTWAGLPGAVDLMARQYPVARRVGRALTVVTAAAVALTLVLLSPFAPAEVSGSKDVDWNRLSQIGAAYGFASAIVSALALAGVAVSLIVQNRVPGTSQVWRAAAGALVGLGAGWALGSRMRLRRQGLIGGLRHVVRNRASTPPTGRARRGG